MRLLPHPRLFLEKLRGTLWFLPALSVTGALLLAVLLVRVEATPDGPLSAVLFTGGADGARGLLGAIIGSIITVTSLTFSLTVVTLQLASSQFSPRLLRTFLRDRGTQATLSMFLSTAVYAVMVLRTIRASADEREEFVPYLAVTVAMALLIASIGVLVYFLNHISQQIRVDTMLRNVDSQTSKVIALVYPDPHDLTAPPLRREPPGNASMLLAARSGWVQGIDADGLAAVGRREGVSLLLTRAVGEQSVEGTPLAWVWPTAPGTGEPDVPALTEVLTDAVSIGFERTIAQDVAFGFRQLVDIASKALSPGVNDPTTAIQVIGHLDHLMCRLAGRNLGDDLHHDDDGALVLVVPRMTFAEALDLSCGQIRRYGCSEPDVAVALLELLRDVGGSCRTQADRELVRLEVARVVRGCERELEESDDLERVRGAASRAEAGTRTPWRPGATVGSLTPPVSSGQQTTATH